jgi:hypothetical protein
MIFALELRAGSDSERLKKSFTSSGLEAEILLAGFKKVFCANQALSAVAAAFHSAFRQNLDITQVALPVSGADEDWNGDRQSRSQNEDDSVAKDEESKSHSGRIPSAQRHFCIFSRKFSILCAVHSHVN